LHNGNLIENAINLNTYSKLLSEGLGSEKTKQILLESPVKQIKKETKRIETALILNNKNKLKVKSIKHFEPNINEMLEKNKTDKTEVSLGTNKYIEPLIESNTDNLENITQNKTKILPGKNRLFKQIKNNLEYKKELEFRFDLDIEIDRLVDIKNINNDLVGFAQKTSIFIFEANKNINEENYSKLNFLNHTPVVDFREEFMEENQQINLKGVLTALNPRVKKYYNLPISLVKENLKKQKEIIIYENIDNYIFSNLSTEEIKNKIPTLKLKIHSNLNDFIISRKINKLQPIEVNESNVIKKNTNIKTEIFLSNKKIFDLQLKLNSKEILKKKITLRIFPYFEKIIKEIK